uniref:Putative secreted protein n=1 Tax=Ixodes ricinus TaxID=34613 RepID=A0A6B0U8U2_IXORI
MLRNQPQFFKILVNLLLLIVQRDLVRGLDFTKKENIERKKKIETRETDLFKWQLCQPAIKYLKSCVSYSSSDFNLYGLRKLCEEEY